VGDERARPREEIATLRLGLDLGACLIDTAEMYGDGRSEELVGEAIADRRERGLPRKQGLSTQTPRARARAGACERSLRPPEGPTASTCTVTATARTVPCAETIDAFEALKKAARSATTAVSNLDLSDMKEWVQLPGGRRRVRTSCSTTSRGAHRMDLLPVAARARASRVMAYFADPSRRGCSCDAKALGVRPAPMA